VMAKPVGSCGACDYWDALDESDHGRCRARPPTVVTAQGHAAWPVTASSDWCGEYKSTAIEANDEPAHPAAA
jgi:hypothetical protein